MKAAFTVAAVILSLLCAAALLALHGIGGQFGLVLHLIPASAIHGLAEALHLFVSREGPIIRSAHGPPFLTPLGVILVYAIPAALLFAAGRATARR